MPASGFPRVSHASESPGPCPFATRIGTAELDGGEARVLAQLRGGDLIRRDAVVKALPRLRIAIRAGEPEGAAPVRLVGELVR